MYITNVHNLFKSTLQGVIAPQVDFLSMHNLWPNNNVQQEFSANHYNSYS